MIDLWNISKQKIDDNLSNYSFNVVGEDGAGKTSFLYALMSRLAPTVTWGYEDRFKAVPNIRVIEHTKWGKITKSEEKENENGSGKHWGHLDTIKKLEKGIKDGKGLPFKNIIIDTVGEACKMCQKYVMNENGWETMVGDRGARYPIVGDVFLDSINELKHMGFVVNFVSHPKDKVETDANGQEYTKACPDVPNQVKHLTMGGIDFILYLEAPIIADEFGENKQIRRLWIKGHPALKLKCPLYGLPKYIEYETVEEGVDKFIEAFNKAVKITQAMVDNNEDISNPNAENEVVPEFVEPTTGKVEDDEPEIKTVELKSYVSVEELQKEAIEIRDMLLETMERNEVVELLKEKLGTAAIKKCTDIDKLTKFLVSYK